MPPSDLLISRKPAKPKPVSRQLAFGSKSSRLERHGQTCKLAVDHQTFHYRKKNTLTRGNNIVFWNPLTNRVVVYRLYVAVWLTFQRSRRPSSRLPPPLSYGSKRQLYPTRLCRQSTSNGFYACDAVQFGLRLTSSINWESSIAFSPVPENFRFFFLTQRTYCA